MISDKAIARISLYRRLLMDLHKEGREAIFSHDLAAIAGGSAAQVRRDLMAIGYSGSPTKGYIIDELVRSISDFLDCARHQNVALIGIGNLGRAILAYFTNRRPNLKIVAAFDNDEHKVNRVIHGCRCYHTDDLEKILQENDVKLGILTVSASGAQGAAEKLVDAGVKGILNFAPIPLKLPRKIYVENVDMSASIEKVAFFARKGK